MASDAGHSAQLWDESRRLLETGRNAEALDRIRELLRRHGERAPILLGAGIAALNLGKYGDAKRYLNRSIKAGGTMVRAHQELSKAHAYTGAWDRALDVLEQGIATMPDGELGISSKADLLRKMGRRAEALAALEPLLGRDRPQPGAVVVFARLSRGGSGAEWALTLCDRLLDDVTTNDAVRTELLFRKAQILDGLGRHDEAWKALESANKSVHAEFDPRGYEAMVNAIIRSWPREQVEALPLPAGRSEQVIFVLGMPRSGTSLVEQILGSHPEVHAGGELPEVNTIMQEISPTWRIGTPGPGAAGLDKRTIDRFGSRLARRYRALSPKSARITDKTLISHEVLGLLTTLLPGCRVICCTREPLDCCLSCYFQYFEGRLPFVYDMEHLASAYCGWWRLMDHWRSVLDVPILDVAYEDLVADQEAQTRRMLDFAGLEWDDRCMRFYETDRVTITASAEQVRRPIYSGSVGRHKPYEKYLGALKDATGGAKTGDTA